MKIYTKKGDKGDTKLLYGDAVSKDSIAPEAYGSVDELVAALGLIRYEKDGTVLKKDIAYSARAKRGSNRNPYLNDDDVISVKNSFYGNYFIKILSIPVFLISKL